MVTKGATFRHLIGAFGYESLRQKRGKESRAVMAEIVNLRTARKRAERGKAERRAAENRLAHGASKKLRTEAAAEQEKLHKTLDSHRIEPGDRR